MAAPFRLTRSFWLALTEGTAWACIGVALCAAFAWHRGAFEPGWKPEARHDGFLSGLLVADFSRRWDGGCSGWRRHEVVRHLVGNLMHWWSYCTIAFVFWRLHPPLKTVPYSTLTLTLVGWFILGCGITHLFSVLTMLCPVYRLDGMWLIANGIVSMTATVFVAFSLTMAFEVVHKHRLDVEQLKVELAELRRRR